MLAVSLRGALAPVLARIRVARRVGRGRAGPAEGLQDGSQLFGDHRLEDQKPEGEEGEGGGEEIHAREPSHAQRGAGEKPVEGVIPKP
jgi:hypothetical protein